MSAADEKRPPAHPRVRRAGRIVWRVYRSAAVLLLSTLVCLIALNALFHVLFRLKDALLPEITPGAAAYHDRLKTVYPALGLSEIRELMAETWDRRLAYDAFAQFREAPYAGRYVNVHQAGFRVGSEQGPWPPPTDAVRIFLFGGSTLFGYGIPDGETIGSHLQRILRERRAPQVVVYNFGQGNHFSTQERALFEQLLLAGHTPDVAVFLDGLNEFCHYTGEPAWTQLLRDFVNQKSDRTSQPWIYRTSLARAASGIRARLGTPSEPAGPAQDPPAPGLLESVAQRYLGNKRLIEAAASAYGARCLFVWQPIPTYRYDPNAHLFLKEGISVPHRYAAPGYALLATRFDDKRLGRNFLWLADIQEQRDEPLYVDQVHYTGAFSRTVAQAIGKWLLDNGYLAEHAR